jgi:hypothetical protein
VDSPDLEAFRLRLYTTSAARTADEARLRTETSIAAISSYIAPADLLLDVEITGSINYTRAIIGDVRILSNVIGSTTVYWTLTRYEPGTADTRAQIYWTLPTSTGPAS